MKFNVLLLNIFLIIFSYLSHADSNSETIKIDFRELSEPSGILFFNGIFAASYRLNMCETVDLQNGLYLKTEFGPFEYSHYVDYSPRATCSGRNVQGAQYLAFGTGAPQPVPYVNQIYSAEMTLFVSEAITTTTLIVRKNLETGEIQEHIYKYIDTDSLLIAIRLSSAAEGDIMDPNSSNVPTCATNLGTITDFDRSYNPWDDTTTFGGYINLRATDIEGRSVVPLKITCNRPLIVIALNTFAVIRYAPDGSSGGGDPVLVEELTVVRSPPSSYRLIQEVIDPVAGIAADGNSAPVVIPPSIFPAPPKAKCKLRTASEKRSIKLYCIDNANGQRVSGCKVQFNVGLGDRRGGHNHDNEFDRPLGKFSLSEDQLFEIPVAGLEFEYTAPEIAGNVVVNFNGSGPSEQTLQTTPLTLDIRNPIPYVRLEDFTWNVIGHDGYYGTVEMRDGINFVRDTFFAEVERHFGISRASLPFVRSGGASLPTGGLFDIGYNWKPSHCGHRDGRTIDISYLWVDERFRAILQDAIEWRFDFTVAAEAPNPPPGSPTPSHWHIALKKANEVKL